MPYRAELKRPDLKGSFPCSVCGKIFCHSSSLSRHRMQAHFKSYTCTQCNQEISSNDTLRSHMFRYHNITRMFMCRCCNWAFPDKTSLHIHMQSMLRNGTPGDVAVLARSSTEADAISVGSPSRSPSFSAESILSNQVVAQRQTNNNNNITLSNNNLHTIFPNLLKPPGGIGGKQMFPLDLSAMGSNQFLSAWLASNPLNANSLNNALALNKTPKSQPEKPAETSLHDDLSSEYDELEVRTTEEDLKEELASADVSPRSVIVKAEPTERKRKLSFDEDAEIDVEGDEEEPPLKMAIDEKHLHITNDQPSPTVSDSHISGSSSQSGESAKCFDCQVAKNKITTFEEKCKAYEKMIRDLQFQLELTRKFPAAPTPTNIPRPLIPQMLIPPMMQMPVASAPNNLLQNPAMRLLFNNLMQNHLNQQQQQQRPMC